MGNPAAVISLIRREVQALDRNLPVFGIRTLADEVDRSITQERLLATLSSLFGLLALLLASVGLYGIMGYRMARRTNEIGIRMALGAQRGEVIWLVLRETLWLVVLGVCIGLPAALASTRLISSRLFGLSPADPATIAAATLVMVAVAAFAGYLPARRASRVDPMTALRYE
jgi:ABC-type antimicrobial peptide transport system permease subunit